MLPSSHSFVLRESVLDKQQLTPVLRTRRISPRALPGSGIEQSVQVITTVSTLPSSKGMDSADPPTSFEGMIERLRAAMARSFG